MNLNFLIWNLENFFLEEDVSPERPLKNKAKIEAIAQVFNEISPDIASLCEVSSKEGLENFCRTYLNDSYEVHLKRGNSPRRIEIGFFVKKSFLQKYDLNAQLKSHAKKPINFLYPHEIKANKDDLKAGRKPRFSSHRMSRDLGELLLTKKGEQTPSLCFLGVHFKSKLDKEGQDWHGLRRRTAESNYVADIYRKREERYHGKCPIFVCGDFNGEIHFSKKDPEFRAFYQIDGLKDFTDHIQMERSQAISFIGMDRHRRPVFMQLDAFVFHERWLRFLDKKESGFYRYKNESGAPYPLPMNPGARHAMPSDHYPIVISWSEDIFKEQKPWQKEAQLFY